MKKKYLYAIPIIFFFLFGSLVLLVALNDSYTNITIEFTSRHLLVGPLLLITWRIFGLVIPAIPAGVVSFAFIPFFGWLATYIYTLVGILIGTSICFLLARKFREPLVKRFLPLQRIHKMEDEMSKKKQFMAIVALRLFTVPIMDFSSYIAGLTKISFKKFILATVIASTPDIGIFYFGEEVYKRVFARNIAVAIAGLFFLGLFYYLFKKYNLKKGNKMEI